MAKISIEGLLDELEGKLKKAVLSTLRKHFEEGSYNEKEFLKTFKKELIEKCYSYESIPNKYVRNN